jgi:hypothetical protein
MPRSHQTLRMVPTVKLLGIMFRNRCWPTTFDTITIGDADGRCRKRLVISPSFSLSSGKLEKFRGLGEPKKCVVTGGERMEKILRPWDVTKEMLLAVKMGNGEGEGCGIYTLHRRTGEEEKSSPMEANR